MHVWFYHRDDGITQNGKIRPAADTVNGIGGGRIAGIEVGGRSRGKMPAGGKAHHTYAAGRYAEFGGARPHQANGALRISQLNRMMVARTQPVFENKRGDSQRVQPVCHLASLVVRSEVQVAAARRHYNRGA